MVHDGISLTGNRTIGNVGVTWKFGHEYNEKYEEGRYTIYHNPISAVGKV